METIYVPLHWIDITIVVIYLTCIIAVGLGVTVLQKIRKVKGVDSIDSYFLGSRNIPWWALAASVNKQLLTHTYIIVLLK